MASSLLNAKSQYHTCQTSCLPEHTLSFQSSMTTCADQGLLNHLTTSSISNGLNGLLDLRECVDKLLQLLFTQQAIAQEHAAQDVGLKSCWMDLLGFWCVWNHKGCLIANKGMRTWTPINYEKKKRRWNGAYRGGREILDFQGGDQKGHPQGLEIKCTTKSRKTLTIISILRK